MSAPGPLAAADGRLGGLRRDPGMERAGGAGASAQEERRRQLQEYLAAKGKLKRPSTKPYLKDRTNHLNPLVKPLSKPEHVAGSKKDVLANAAKGARKDDERGVTRRAGHDPQQRSSNATQRAAVVPPEQFRKSTKLPPGLIPSTNHSAQPRRLPTSTSCHLNAEGTEEAAKETVTAVVLTGSDLLPGAARSLNKSLQERLVCNKENFPGQAPSDPALSSVLQSDGNGPRNRKVLAHKQTSGAISRTIRGPKDRTNSHQKREELIHDQLGKSLLASKNASQKPSSKTPALQPPLLPAVSRTWLHKKPGAKHESINTARQPVGKPLGTLPAGGFKHHSRAPHLKRSPAKPPASSRPQVTAKPGSPRRSSLRLAGAGQRQRTVVKGEAGRKDVKMVPQGRTAASQVTGPQNQARSAHGSKTQAIESEFKTRREQLKPELPKASGVQAKRVPKTPSAEDRKKQLEQWLASKGKSYKRPPMTLPPKKPVKEKLPFRSDAKEEKEEKPEQFCLDRINSILTDCLKLVEEGVPSEELLEMLSHVPHAEKFAKFWICKAKLLARSGPFDATGLYKEAVCAGAVPLEELREVVLGILKTTERTSEGEKAEQPALWQPATPCPSERQHVGATPCLTGKCPTSLPVSSIKLQVVSIPRRKERPEGQELKFLTPVRRSLRIERAGSRYPEMLKDHDTVVSSLDELLDGEEESQLFFRKNKALPEVAEMEVLAL
ncbi:cytoskeleton-associated protein 2-like [Dromaius novaehollandiae]|uniref:cytoskeleton-associated protein 2-like n=1 Tax=Dromaius novaehollandiae TaxID=8790 RepID=UPI00311FD889